MTCYIRSTLRIFVYVLLSSDVGKIQSLSHTLEKETKQISWFCKDNNISKIFTNFQLRSGLKAGNITDKGVVTSHNQCIGYCCQDRHCNVALTLKKNCFLVACKTYSGCMPQPATDKNFHSQLVYINWEVPTEEVQTKGWCKCSNSKFCANETVAKNLYEFVENH